MRRSAPIATAAPINAMPQFISGHGSGKKAAETRATPLFTR